MGKGARRERREEHVYRNRHQAAAAASDNARRGVSVAHVEIVRTLNREYGRHVFKIDLDRLVTDRDYWAQRAAWPSWCWYPSALIAGRLYRDFQTDAVRVGRPVESPAVEIAAVALAAMVAWQHSRLTVVFDPDMATALAASSQPDDVFPAEVLLHLPVWSLWLDLSHIHPQAGAFVALDSDDLTYFDHSAGNRLRAHDRAVDALVALIVFDSDIVVMRLGLTDQSVTDCFARRPRSDDYERRARLLGPDPDDDVVARLGGDVPGLLAHVMGLILYLCSDEPDLARVEPSRPPTRHVSNDAPATTAIEAGFRVGAALRRSRPARNDPDVAHYGRRVAAHLRRAHWHTYWTGPRNNPTARTRRLRWLTPIPVNADLDDGTTVTMRPVSPSPDGRQALH
jgi:hypothetical protein